MSLSLEVKSRAVRFHLVLYIKWYINEVADRSNDVIYVMVVGSTDPVFGPVRMSGRQTKGEE